jgi:homogentisate 1,2-dioxygenase
MDMEEKILSSGDIHSWSDAPFYYITQDTKKAVFDGMIRYLKYESDWNLIAELIQKIRLVSLELKCIDLVGLEQSLNPFTYNIEQIGRTCIEFIKRYNHETN